VFPLAFTGKSLFDFESLLFDYRSVFQERLMNFAALQNPNLSGMCELDPMKGSTDNGARCSVPAEAVAANLNQAGVAAQQHALQEALLKEMLNNTKQAIILLNESGEIIFASPEIEAMLSYKPEELISQSAFGFFRHIDFPLTQQHHEGFCQQEAHVTSVVAQIRHKSGEFVWADLMLKNLLHQNPINGLFVLVCRTTTQKEDEDLSVVQAIVHAREEERTFMAAELHDNVNQILTATKLLVDTVIREGNKERLLQLCSNHLKMATEEVRRLSYSMAGYELMEHGLIYAIKNMAGTTRSGSAIKFHLQLDEVLEHSLQANHQLHLYRIVQEAITNILKHSQATEVHIIFMQKDNLGALLIKDNGKGFRLDGLKKGMGLSSITHRVTLLKGHFKIMAHQNQGTALEIHFPL
jgi:PAS domain S-box-containing protein